MDKNSIITINEIFTDDVFSSGCRCGKDGHELFPIVRSWDPGKLIVIRKLFATRNNKPLYWIDNMPGKPSMDAEEVEREVIKDIMEGLVWENIK